MDQLPRFDIVVSNHNRGEVFWKSFHKIKNFDNKKDRLIIMDCSNDLEKERNKIPKRISKLLKCTYNLYFIKRRNWNLNHGAQLDYIRLISEKKILKPKLVFFMQDHYLNTEHFVNGDTIPERENIDLNMIEKYFIERPKSVWFCSRNGFRVGVKYNRIYDYYKFGDSPDLILQNVTPISLVVDGGNFCVKPDDYIKDYLKYKDKYIKGSGDVYFCHVWETRLCKILYDQKYSFYESQRKLRFSSIEELKKKYPNPGKVWLYSYLTPLAYFLYGQDVYRSYFNFIYFREIFYGHNVLKSAFSLENFCHFAKNLVRRLFYSRNISLNLETH